MLYGNYIVNIIMRTYRREALTGNTKKRWKYEHMLYANIYIDLMAGKSVTFMTKHHPETVEFKFKRLFGVNVKLLKKGKNNYKLINNGQKL